MPFQHALYILNLRNLSRKYNLWVQSAHSEFNLALVTELSRRYRAARAWAGLKQSELAEQLGIDATTVMRREAGEADPKRGEQLAVAKITGVPADFLLGGFQALGAEPSRQELSERLEHVEGAVRVLVGVAAGISLTDLQDQLTDNVTRALLGLDAVESERPGQSKDGEAGAS